MPAEETVRHDPPRVAVIYEVPPPKDYLQDALQEAHIPVAATYRAGDLDDLEIAGADVILVTLDEAMEPYLERITEFMTGTSLPVVFEECEASRHLEGWERNRWLRHLRAKLLGSSDTRPPLPRRAANDRPAAPDPGPPGGLPVWVLGASIGGPESVRRFLEALPADVPAAFVLAQHMGPEFQSVFADRLARVTELEVVCAEDGMDLRPGRVIVAPADAEVGFDEDRRVRLAPREAVSGSTPSIDHVLTAVSDVFGGDARAIIFSGQARDGIDGCTAIRRHGGEVWTQDAASSSISVIADGIRDAGLSTFQGTPEQLARRMVEYSRARGTGRQERG